MKYTSKEALENISVEFDTMGMICSNIAYKDFWEKDLHFKEIFGCEYEIIMKDLKRLEQLEKENIKLKQAIKVLKEKGLIFTSGESGRENCICLCDYGYGVSLTQEEYELLKEVLESDR